MFDALLPYLIPVLAAGIVWLLYKIFKVEVDKTKIEAILTILKEIIFNIETRYEKSTGVEKKKAAISMADTLLDKERKGVVRRTFGTLENAVQTAFRIVQPALELRKLVNNIRGK